MKNTMPIKKTCTESQISKTLSAFSEPHFCILSVKSTFFYKHSVFQCEARISMLKFFTNLASKYAYLKTFKRANFII